MLKISKKCKGIPTAAKITAAPRPNEVLGTGAPKPANRKDRKFDVRHIANIDYHFVMSCYIFAFLIMTFKMFSMQSKRY